MTSNTALVLNAGDMLVTFSDDSIANSRSKRKSAAGVATIMQQLTPKKTPTNPQKANTSPAPASRTSPKSSVRASKSQGGVARKLSSSFSARKSASMTLKNRAEAQNEAQEDSVNVSATAACSER